MNYIQNQKIVPGKIHRKVFGVLKNILIMYITGIEIIIFLSALGALWYSNLGGDQGPKGSQDIDRTKVRPKDKFKHF